MRAAVIRDGDGLVVNVIAVEDLTFLVDPGHTLRDARGAGPGWTWNGVNFDPPPLQSINDLRAAIEAEFIAESVKRAAAHVEDWDTLDNIKAMTGLLSSAAISSMATPAQIKARDIYLYARDTASAKLAALTTRTELNAVAPARVDPFRDSITWPT